MSTKRLLFQFFIFSLLMVIHLYCRMIKKGEEASPILLAGGF